MFGRKQARTNKSRERKFGFAYLFVVIPPLSRDHMFVATFCVDVCSLFGFCHIAD
ncbi:MAG: hypothetical protein RLZZ256_482, partial [Bacteroidota bacterium]